MDEQTRSTARSARFGGAFLLASGQPEAIFTPEDKTSEHRMIEQTARDFVQREVLPRLDETEQGAHDVIVHLLKQAGELGLLAHSVPEAYGGLGLDKVASSIVSEHIGGTGGYGVAHLNHTGIATLPVTYFGSSYQRNRVLSRLADGTYIGAYCLTEPESGSDALSARTTAHLNAAGTHYVLNGTKQFITSAGFADTFIVYAQVDGNQFSAFLVERTMPGVSVGPEENKMGLHGSSTCQVIFDDCEVPAEHLIGEVGRGPQIALGVLNIGRFNLGAAALGGSKGALAKTVRYVTSRRQFKRPLSEFGLTRLKLAHLASRIYAAESIQYRTAGYLEEALGPVQPDMDAREVGSRLRRFALECAICKVFGSETQDQVVDEAVQLHGGYGYIVEYGVERMYRDARISRIFEGTNEINRLLIPDTLIREATKSGISLEQAVKAALQRFKAPLPEAASTLDSLAGVAQLVADVAVVLTGAAVQRYGQGLAEEQAVLARIADLVIAAYALDSVARRAAKAAEGAGASLHVDLAAIFAHQQLAEAEATLRALVTDVFDSESAVSFAQGFALKAIGLASASDQQAVHRVADKLVASGGYPLG